MSNSAIGFFAPEPNKSTGARTQMTYILSHEAYYWPTSQLDKTVVAEINVMGDPAGDEPNWEFMIRWHDLGEYGLAARVEIFHDGWPAFYQIPEFFGRLASLDGNPTTTEVVAMLDQLRWEDVTPRERAS